jgi:enamine deaminase RidA (YjgF/YER057c/UK114 family)
MSATIAQPLARYAAYRRVGDFIFLSGIIPVDPALKQVVRGYDEIPVEARKLLGESGEFSVDIKEGPILAQSWAVLDRVRQTVEAAGGGMQDVFKLVQYFRNLDHFPYYNRVRKLFFPGELPVSTVVEVSGLMPAADVLIEVEATAYLPLAR